MQGMISKVQRFLISEDGPTAVEYAVMVALVIVGCITAINGLTGSIKNNFNTVGNSIGS